jgi:hypothetical protein
MLFVSVSLSCMFLISAGLSLYAYFFLSWFGCAFLCVGIERLCWFFDGFVKINVNDTGNSIF